LGVHQGCVTEALSKAILLPATDCLGTRLKSNASGGIVWGSNKGTYVKFANEGGIIAFLRPECLSKSS
jgi:hypothetical protein